MGIVEIISLIEQAEKKARQRLALVNEIAKQRVVMKNGEEYVLAEITGYHSTTVTIYKNGQKIIVPMVDVKHIYKKDDE